MYNNSYIVIMYTMITKCLLLMYYKAIGYVGNAIHIYEVSKGYLYTYIALNLIEH